MALTRAQVLAGDDSQGVVLDDQVQAVKVDLESGIKILPDGTLRTAPEQINYYVELNNDTAYNRYIWPDASPPTNSVLVAQINGADSPVNFWTIGQDNGPGNPIIGTVYTVDVSPGTTGLTFTGGPVTSAGVITAGGILVVENGGTGADNPSDARDNLGAGTVRQVNAGPGLLTTPASGITVNGDVYVPDSGVVAGTYTLATITVDQRGFVTFASSGTAFPIGTVMLFQQATAPPSFTKNTNLDNYALRLVGGGSGGGTGGQQPFTTSFASYTPQGSVDVSGSSSSGGYINYSLRAVGSSDGASISTGQMPSHSHGYYQRPPNGGQRGDANGVNNQSFASTTSAGGNGQHAHGVNVPVSGSINFTPTGGSVNASGTLNGSQTSQFVVRYVDLISCTKTSV